MAGTTGASELLAAAAREAHTLAELTTGAVRKRLLVLAHVLEQAGRELTSAPAAGADTQLAAPIRAGEHDAELVALVQQFRAEVRSRLAVVHPGYDRPGTAPE